MTSRGVVMVLALVVMGLATALMAAVATHAQLDASRTALAIDDAQVGQLLTAGIQTAAASARVGNFTSSAISAPVGEIKMSWDNAAPSTVRRCTIDVRFGKTHRSAFYTYPAARE